ncbi:hypothetical protein CDL12_28483 [Handroanthus impetiginosus]|uniref:Uncharacterized protein n=1 Tax=Handroanthus impetiginosus TaxID=429701 RepID=A0A2G9G122_9LAMI|nr:hypothetical protein CDL12_28483 [Handroanthus impetiginosus]
MDTNEHIEKFKKYEAEVKEYLKKKYFPNNTILEGVKDGQRSATDGLPLYQSLQDHKTFLELIREKPSASAETTTSRNSKGKPST